MRSLLTGCFTRLFASHSADEDVARREFILNVLLVGILTIFAVAVAHNSLEQLVGESNTMSLWTLIVMLTFFGLLYAVSKMQKGRIAATLLIGSILVFAMYLGFRWGVNLPAGILLNVLAITMAGVLISTRAAYITTLTIIGYICVVGWQQASGRIEVDRSWALAGWHIGEISLASAILLLIATVAWLGNREIEKSLIRARDSEHELKVERDQLEARIIKRTEELRKAELDRLSQAYRFVEFGRLAGSIFHDLSNPLAALSLNIESIAKGAKTTQQVATFAEDISRAQNAATHMQKLMTSMRRHLSRDSQEELFGVTHILSEVIQVLTPYARTRMVTLARTGPESLELYGNPVAFLQIITNIVSNGIESFPAMESSDINRKRVIEIETLQEEGMITLTVTDNGSGIPADMTQQIFEPFFSTRHGAGGMGIGLPLTKHLLERSFEGTLEVKSTLGKGTSFVLRFPVRRR